MRCGDYTRSKCVINRSVSCIVVETAAHRLIANTSACQITYSGSLSLSFDDKEEFTSRDEANLVLTETRTFAPSEMIRCDKCARQSAPTRIECLYCGAPLPVRDAGASLMRRPTLKPLAAHEHGFNVIFMPKMAATVTARLSQNSIDETAAWLRVSATDLASMLQAGVPLPLARTASMDEAQLIAGKLAALNLSVMVLDDKSLTTPNAKRARKIEIGEETLTLMCGDAATGVRVSWSEISLLVAGRIVNKQIEVEERRGRAKSEIVDEREIVSDKHALDIHTAARVGEGWRIESDGFDFSCLGARKGLLASENFALLTQTLTKHAGDAARCDDSYNRVRRLLALVWPPDERTESRGLRRATVGRFHTEAVTLISNETQFARYSQLCSQIELRRRTLEL